MRITLRRNEVFQFAEYFAGDANVSFCMRASGYSIVNFDARFGGREQNFFEPSGFALLCFTSGLSSYCL